MSRHTSQAKLQLWKDRFEQFRQSEQTIQQFCRTLGCGRSSFHYWQRKLDPNRQSKPSTNLVVSSAFLPVVLRDSSSKCVVLRACDGTRVSVPVDALAALDTALQHAWPVVR
jgi:transposase-like protein